MKTAVFQPTVEIDSLGFVTTDWFASYLYTVDADDGRTLYDETGELASDQLDRRLDQIRDLLKVDHGSLAELVRPFFEEKS